MEVSRERKDAGEWLSAVVEEEQCVPACHMAGLS